MIIVFMVSTAMVFSGSLFYVWSRLKTVNLSYDISRQTQLQRDLIQQNKRLNLEVATLKSPDRIEKIARKELGMIVPERGQVEVIHYAH